MSYDVKAAQKEDVCLLYRSFARARMRAARGEFRCAVKSSPNLDEDSL